MDPVPLENRVAGLIGVALLLIPLVLSFTAPTDDRGPVQRYHGYRKAGHLLIFFLAIAAVLWFTSMFTID